jgi:hypothetical protein
MNVIDLYNNLNSCILSLKNREIKKNEKLQQCQELYLCAQQNSRYIQNFNSLSDDISARFDTQRFDVQPVLIGFDQVGKVEKKIAEIQYYMQENTKYLKRLFKNQPEHSALSVGNFYSVNFSNSGNAINSLTEIYDELEIAKAEDIERQERIKENWKTAGTVSWTIIKYAAMVVGFIFVIIGGIIKIFASSSKKD